MLDATARLNLTLGQKIAECEYLKDQAAHLTKMNEELQKQVDAFEAPADEEAPTESGT